MGERFEPDASLLPELMAAEILIVSEALGPMPLTLHPITALQLAGTVQLACRHPSVTPEIRATAARFLGAVREYFADCPAVLEVLRRGDEQPRVS